MRLTTSVASVLASVAALGLVPAAFAHGGDMEMGIGVDHPADMNMTTDAPWSEPSYPPTYFAHGDHKAAIYSHIALMVVGWVFVLPAGKLEAFT